MSICNSIKIYTFTGLTLHDRRLQSILGKWFVTTDQGQGNILLPVSDQRSTTCQVTNETSSKTGNTTSNAFRFFALQHKIGYQVFSLITKLDPLRCILPLVEQEPFLQQLVLHALPPLPPPHLLYSTVSFA